MNESKVRKQGVEMELLKSVNETPTDRMCILLGIVPKVWKNASVASLYKRKTINLLNILGKMYAETFGESN